MFNEIRERIAGPITLDWPQAPMAAENVFFKISSSWLQSILPTIETLKAARKTLKKILTYGFRIGCAGIGGLLGWGALLTDWYPNWGIKIVLLACGVLWAAMPALFMLMPQDEPQYYGWDSK